VILIAGLLVAAQARAQDVAKDVEAAVHAIQAAYDKGDVKALEGMMTANHVAITSYLQYFDRADHLAHLSNSRISKYEIRDVRVTVVGQEVALVTYRATIAGTYRARKMPSHVIVGATWVQQDGKWREAMYQETAVGK